MKETLPVAAPIRPVRVPSGFRLATFLQGQVFTRVILVLGALFFVTPVYWMLITSMKTPEELAAFPPALLPQRWSWDNFRAAIDYIPFWRYFLNSLIVAVCTAIGAVLSNFIVAYGFSRVQWKGRDTLFLLMLSTIFIPFPVTMVPLFVLFAKLNWINTFLPLIVPAFFGSPYYIFLLRQFLMQLPGEVTEAAKIDGASEAQVMRFVVLPLAKPALTVVAIFAFIAAWNDFLGPMIYLQDDSKYTLAIGLQMFRSTHAVSLNLLMAASFLSVLPIIVLFVLFQRAFIDGITVGSIK